MAVTDPTGARPRLEALARWWAPSLVAVLLGAFVLLAAGSVARPYLFDEANFLFQAQAIARTGIPYANMGYMGDRGEVTTRFQYGLWHPPLYLYLLGLNARLFGGAEVAARGMGIACMLLSAGLVYALARAVAESPARGRALGALALALFLLSPLTVQSAVVVDIDGTVLLPLVTLWVLAYLRLAQAPPQRRLLVLGGLLALALWAKTTTPLLLPVAAVLYEGLRGRWRAGALEALGVVGLGVGGFLASWAAVAGWLGLPFAMPFEWNAWQFQDASNYTRGWLGDWARMRQELAPALVWASPYLVALLGLVAVARARQWVRGAGARPVDLPLLVGLLVFGFYFIKLAANFPKYHVGMLPFGSVAAAWWLLGAWHGGPAGPRWLVAGALVGAGTLHLALVGDAWMWTPALVWEPVPLLVAVGLFVVGVLALSPWRCPRWAHWAGLLLVVLYLGWAIGVDVVQARADYSTHYYYGTRGQREAAAALDALGHEGPWIGPKEVAWYARNQYYIDSDTFWWLVIARGFQFRGSVLGYDVPVVVVWTMDPAVRAFFEAQLGERYVLHGEIADYAIWRRRE